MAEGFAGFRIASLVCAVLHFLHLSPKKIPHLPPVLAARIEVDIQHVVRPP